MSKVIVAVLDSKADRWTTAVVANSAEAAIRSFVSEVQRSETALSTNPEDFQLWQLAEFADQLIPGESLVNPLSSNFRVLMSGDEAWLAAQKRKAEERIRERKSMEAFSKLPPMEPVDQSGAAVL